MLLRGSGKIGGRSRTRTYDPLIKSQLLYHLSYAPVRPACESGGQLGLPPYQRPRALSMEALSPRMPCLGLSAKIGRPATETSVGGFLRAHTRIKAPLRFPRQIPVN